VSAATPAAGASPPHPIASAVESSARASLLLAALCAAMGLAGYILGIERLERFVLGWPRMQPLSALAALGTAAALALTLSPSASRRAAGLLTLACTALAVLVGLHLPASLPLRIGPIDAYPASALLLIMAAIALGARPGARQVVATRVLATASAALLLIALIGISYRLLLGLPPLVHISLPSLIAFLLLTYAAAFVRPDRWLLDRLASERPGALMTRRLLPAVLFLPLAIGWLELAGEGYEVLDSAFGAVLQTVLTMCGLGALVLWGARKLDRLDVRRDEAEQALRRAYEELDRRVEERTAAYERTNAALQESLAVLRGMAESTPDLIVVKDAQGRVVMSNPAHLTAIGRAESEVVGKTARQFLSDAELAERIMNQDRHVMSSGRVERVEELMPTPDGPRTYLATKSPLRDVKGNVTGVIIVATDITERKSAELERERLISVEQNLRRDAERANRAKDEFLAIVSHELRSPLNALRGWGFLLGSAKMPDAALIERATHAIKRNVDHQARLIEDLLDTSRIMSGKLNIERRPVNLVDVTQGAIEVVKQSAVAKGVALAFDTERPTVMLEGDAARLHQIAVNLLSNAVKFTPEGGEIKVHIATVGESASLSILDTGAGIEPEFLPRVFERFSQADTSTTRRHGGLGIGLALVRHLAELHGGKVAATSDGRGKGSTFTVELPLMAPGDRPEAHGATAHATSAVSGGLAGVKICALDDDPDARDIINLTLRQAGAEVHSVATGAELIAALDKELPAQRPDVLLMDLAMPDEDGFSVLARVRALEGRKAIPRGSEIPAIAVTAFTEVSRDRVIEHGFTDHVSKPIDPARLVATIRRAMNS
jgi:PAS domain S-box-containing protein